MKKKQCLARIRTLSVFACVLWNLCGIDSTIGAEGLVPGLKVRFRTADSQDVDVATRPNVWLFVPAGNPPTPFLRPGQVEAQWDGFVSLDLRSEYTFHTHFRGELELQLNGTTVLNTNSTGDTSIRSKSIRLNKGTNNFRASFRGLPQGDAWLRVEWAARDGLPRPIPQSALSSATDAELDRGELLRLGRELLGKHRCLRCHTDSGSPAHAIDLTMDAPALESIGARRNYNWLFKWILNPKAHRSDAAMPQMFRGSDSEKKAAAVASFLASLKPASREEKHADADAQIGKDLFEKLHCAACHVAPDTNDIDATRLSLKHVREKFSPGALARFLKAPEADYAWIKMPNFRLSDDEAAQLSAYLESNASASTSGVAAHDQAAIDRGRQLVQTSGCLSCHTLNLPNQFSTKPLRAIPSDRWSNGCLAAANNDNSNAPNFSLSEQELRALRLFAASDRKSIDRFVPAEFAQQEIRRLNCAGCHGKVDGLPPIEILGGKLRPEWSARFMGGEISYKPRPWLDARMPAFKASAKHLADGMAMLHGHPAQTPAEPPINGAAAEIGRKLVSAAGGFSCISCHAVGELAATQVFESAGINLAYSGERLLKDYYQRWVLNPLLIDPATKMPVYFDEKGQSPLTELYEGNGIRQIDAIWQYLRLGPKMTPPGSEP